MIRHRRTLLTMAAAAILVFGGMGTAEAEAAAPEADSRAAEAELADGTPVRSARELDYLERYWTPERMRAAKPMTEPADATDGPADEYTEGPEGSTPPAPPRLSSGAGLMTHINETRVVGKVFFTRPGGGDRVCSASALNTASRQLVMTAGHCVHEGSGGDWMKNWVYVPRYRNGNRPFGTFKAKQFRTFNSWIGSSNKKRDVGLATTHPLNGNKLVHVTGGNGLSWNKSKYAQRTTFGYPGNKDNGQIQWVCTGKTRRAVDGRVSLKCNFGGGSSGGPWVRNHDNGTGYGWNNGVFGSLCCGGWNRSPYFDGSVKNMVDAQANVT